MDQQDLGGIGAEIRGDEGGFRDTAGNGTDQAGQQVGISSQTQ